jgi:large subunit ribosomal protein L35e
MYTVAKKFKEGYTFVRNRFDLVNIFFQGKKYIPLDLRPKKTRAIRKALTPHEASLMTLKETRRLKAFPMRKFAVKA